MGVILDGAVGGTLQNRSVAVALRIVNKVKGKET